MEVAIEPCLVDGRNWAESHGHSGELPKVSHEPRVWIGGETLPSRFSAEVLQLLFGYSAFKEGSSVDAGGSVPLEIDLVASALGFAALEKVIEADFVKTCGGSVAGNMAADARKSFVGSLNHGHGIPADDASNAFFHDLVTGKVGFFEGGYGVDIGSLN